jgi:hypothetical protein
MEWAADRGEELTMAKFEKGHPRMDKNKRILNACSNSFVTLRDGRYRDRFVSIRGYSFVD